MKTVVSNGQGEQLSKSSLIQKRSRLERQSWRNWILLASVAIITTIGLASALPPLLGERVINPWPWAKTDFVLLVGLSLIVLVFIAYLTQQQRQVIHMRKRLRQLEKEKTQQVDQNNARLFALLNVSRKMCSEVDMQGIFDCITETCAEIFKCYRASLMLLDKKSHELVVSSANGNIVERLIGARMKLGDGIAGWVAEKREAILLGRNCDLSRYPGLQVNDTYTMAAMVAPIMLRDELVGVINVSTMAPEATFDEEDLQALKVFAENAGVFIRHTEHAVWMRKTISKLQETVRKNHPQMILQEEKSIKEVE